MLSTRTATPKRQSKVVGTALPFPLVLSDTQLVALSAGAQDRAGLIAIPPSLKGAAVNTFGRKLVSLGLAGERAAKRGETPWRRDGDSGDAFVLVITPAGLAAIGVDEGEAQAHPAEPAVSSAKVAPPSKRSSVIAKATPRLRSDTAADAPPTGSKQTQLIALLSAPGGATIDTLVTTLGWLPHTTRAALTGLRKKGHVVERERTENGDGDSATTRYRIVPAMGSAAAAKPVAPGAKVR